MFKFKYLNIGVRLIILISIFLVSIILLGIIFIHSLKLLQVNGPIYQDIIQGKNIIADILPPPQYIIESYLKVYLLVNSYNDIELKEIENKLLELEKEYNVRHEYWKSVLNDSEIKQLLTYDSYIYATNFYKIVKDELIPAINNSNRELALNIIKNKIKNEYDNHRKIIDRIVILVNNENSKREKIANIKIKNTYIILVLIFILTFIILLLTGAVIIMSITKPLSRIQNTINKISKSLENSINKINIGSKELSEDSSILSSSILEINSLISKFNEFMNEDINNYNKVSNLLVEFQKEFKDTTEKMINMKKTTDLIHENSKKIESIINVIDEIAFQTNILALNASVEAAHAGEVGKGFAVVSEQVKDLANRSVIASKDTSSLIENAIKSVEEGESLVKKVLLSQEKNNNISNDIKAMINEIVEHENQKSELLTNINGSVNNLKKIIEDLNFALSNNKKIISTLEIEKKNLFVIVDSLNKLLE